MSFYLNHQRQQLNISLHHQHQYCFNKCVPVNILHENKECVTKCRAVTQDKEELITNYITKIMAHASSNRQQQAKLQKEDLFNFPDYMFKSQVTSGVMPDLSTGSLFAKNK